MSFYVTLPSDSSMHFFPENKISHFKTQLPSPVCLNGEWEVGLSEIIYPHSWLNVNETNNYFLYKAGDGNISSTVKRTIDVGCYETMLDIISAVQLALPKNPNRFTIIYNKATKRVKINAVQGSSLHLENLGELLGFKRNAIIIGKDGETISQYYDRPQYLPLVRHSFQTIQSELRLNSGDFVPFERGQIGSSLTHYKGINFQKGYGIGGIFRRLFRAALPFSKRRPNAKKTFVGCVDNEAFHGAFSKSPYEFKHFNLNFIGVYVDGQPVPHNPLELDFSKDQYIRAYQTLFVGTDRMGQDRVEYFLMVFDGLEQIGLGTEHMALGVIVHCWDSVCDVSGSVVLMGWTKPRCSSFD
ncbi:uncharacterized protein TNCV_4724651 [Trichonephila clavipes]|uniref:Uncharacterized protein n=1 Tax=Trichonephila clavipes TaxID=2585209 RepID=A0A8X6W7A7_TRICX|nr:uncharacterized protein TNCV_4724651 [Trichonephila clavipes]